MQIQCFFLIINTYLHNFHTLKKCSYNGEYEMVKNQKIHLLVDENLCKGVDGCGLCIHVCPRDVYEKAAKLTPRGFRSPVPVRPDNCNGCMLCMVFCPDFAIVVERVKEKVVKEQ